MPKFHSRAEEIQEENTRKGRGGKGREGYQGIEIKLDAGTEEELRETRMGLPRLWMAATKLTWLERRCELTVSATQDTAIDSLPEPNDIVVIVAFDIQLA
ncbi:hypothetical protein AXG93_4332s1050 [Marchantia polymorpha subsp. ruderalis]|uniref:Uncharacterized protein n=1 Tax=Marchantia polymorpha subsp. ruderalis TaxID=1480154 RepID=A0A176W2E9_MARPO|nr:hypothetical protein AXG93_4332s1050 [Marchantia polymorpha subsp. ruderalis]